MLYTVFSMTAVAKVMAGLYFILYTIYHIHHTPKPVAEI